MRKKLLFLFILVFFGCLAQFSSDVYAPSLPAIANALDARMDHVQQSMAIYMLGIALSQLIYGPLSEGYGRKPPLVVGLIIMLIGSMICLMTTSIQTLLVGRFIQGVGGGACSALWRSMFRDEFSQEELAKYSSFVAIFISFFIPAAPAIGGYIQHFYGWRSVFLVITAYVVIAFFLVTFGLHETNKTAHKDKLQWPFIKGSFAQLLTHRPFMLVTCCSFLIYGAYFTLYVISPVLFIKYMGLKASHYGVAMFAMSCTATLFGGVINGQVVQKVGSSFMLRIAFSLICFSALAMFVTHLAWGTHLPTLLLQLGVFQFGCVLVFPNVFSKAFDSVGHIAGYASSMYSLMQISGAAVIGALASRLPDSTVVPLASVILIAGLLSWLLFEASERC